MVEPTIDPIVAFLQSFPREIAYTLAAQRFLSVVKPLLKNYFDSVKSLFEGLSESTGPLEIKNRTVSEFWALDQASSISKAAPFERREGVMRAISKKGRLIGVEIELGCLLPYGPLIPAHPLARPAYSPQGWDLVDESLGLRRQAYDVLDNLLYADRVIRVPPRRDYFYAGLYDYCYGISIVGLPLLIHRSVLRKASEDLEQMWEIGSRPLGSAARIRGNLLLVTSSYSSNFELIPGQYRGLPAWGLEVTGLQTLKNLPQGVTHVAAPIDWLRAGREKELAHYFNVQDGDQFGYVCGELDAIREQHRRTVVFDYDDVSLWRPRRGLRVPQYNEILRGWFETAL